MQLMCACAFAFVHDHIVVHICPCLASIALAARTPTGLEHRDLPDSYPGFPSVFLEKLLHFLDFQATIVLAESTS